MPKRRRSPMEADADDKVDAVTAEPLHPQRHISIHSPDGTMSLRYNTSTVVRIAMEMGGPMQPPHFREPMDAALWDEVQRLEGRKIVIRAGERPIGDHAEVSHRAMLFEQWLESALLLRREEVYVCPHCYKHYAGTVLARNAERVDPLDVLARLGGAVKFVAFRRAVDWKRHLALHQAGTLSAASEFRLRDFINRTLLTRKNEALERGRDRVVNSTHSYWQRNARFNVMRYNRLVDATEAALGDESLATHCEFPDAEVEYMNVRGTAPASESDDSNFIDDSDEGEGVDEGVHLRYESSDTSSSISSSEASKDEDSSSSTQDTNRSSHSSSTSKSSKTSSSDSSESEIQKRKRKVAAVVPRHHPSQLPDVALEQSWLLRQQERMERRSGLQCPLRPTTGEQSTLDEWQSSAQKLQRRKASCLLLDD